MGEKPLEGVLRGLDATPASKLNVGDSPGKVAAVVVTVVLVLVVVVIAGSGGGGTLLGKVKQAASELGEAMT